MDKRDADILKAIIKYCMQIDEANRKFGNDREKFISDSVYRNAAAMCVLQIGELAKHLSEGFISHTSDEIPWHQIKGLRNVVAHEYGNIDEETLWETVSDDIPTLRSFCEKQLSQYGNET